MTQLTREHHDLPAVMAFMRREVGKNVSDVQGEVAPHVRRRDRNAAAAVAAEPKKIVDTPTAALERGHQLLSADFPAIHAVRHRNAMLLTDHLDPHATSVVNMSRDHTDRAPRRTGNTRPPERGRQILDEKDRDAVVGLPRRENHVPKFSRGRHCLSLDRSRSLREVG